MERTLLKHKYSMTGNVKMNYKGDPSFTKHLWKYQDCMNQDTESRKSKQPLIRSFSDDHLT